MNSENDGPSWAVSCAGETVGRLTLESVDQPWFLCSFTPGTSWERWRPLFDAQDEAREALFPPDKIGAVAAVRAQGFTLVPEAEGPVITPAFLYIHEGKASFRY
ncbi:hypothetical protein ABZ614_41225 [Streptomyces sp. NPDC013178]|uniref:hypothetical protein n=1 Tax=unclassified Streptomyces TaxID=2593676 RepID=UPI0033C8DCD1